MTARQSAAPAGSGRPSLRPRPDAKNSAAASIAVRFPAWAARSYQRRAEESERGTPLPSANIAAMRVCAHARTQGSAPG